MNGQIDPIVAALLKQQGGGQPMGGMQIPQGQMPMGQPQGMPQQGMPMGAPGSIDEATLQRMQMMQAYEQMMRQGR